MRTLKIVLFTIGAMLAAGVLLFLGLIALGVILFLTEPRGPSVQDMALMANVGHRVMGMKRSDAYALLRMHGLLARNTMSFKYHDRGKGHVSGLRSVDWPPQFIKTRDGTTHKIDQVEVNYGSTESCHQFEVQTLSFGADDRVDIVTHQPDGVCM